MIDVSKGFTLVRTFEATPEELWKARTDPESAAQWWHPRGASTPRESVEIDARVGGSYTYTMVNDASGETVITGGVYREVVPFKRLVFTWGYPNGEPDDTPVVTITLEPVGERTRMTFDLRGVDGKKGDGSFYDGWQGALDSFGEHLVDAQQVAEELAQPGAQDLLKDASLARLAYNGPDGLPRVIPIGFFWNGDEIVICTAVTAPKVRALSKRPDVALTIDVGDTPATARALSIRGSASVEIVDGVPSEYIAGSRKVLGEEGVAEFERNVRAFYAEMARITIKPRWVRYYDFGAGRLPKFLSKLAENASK